MDSGTNDSIFAGIRSWALDSSRYSRRCPNHLIARRRLFVTAAFHFGLSEGLADALSGLPGGTIGSRADGEAAFAAMPGTGFLPIPDLFYQFHAQARKKIITDIRKALRKDAKKGRR